MYHIILKQVLSLVGVSVAYRARPDLKDRMDGKCKLIGLKARQIGIGKGGRPCSRASADVVSGSC